MDRLFHGLNDAELRNMLDWPARYFVHHGYLGKLLFWKVWKIRKFYASITELKQRIREELELRQNNQEERHDKEKRPVAKLA